MRETKETRFHPWVGKTPCRRASSPLQYSCLENPMDRGTWRATVHRVTDSDTTEATSDARLHKRSEWGKEGCKQAGSHIQCCLVGSLPPLMGASLVGNTGNGWSHRGAGALWGSPSRALGPLEPPTCTPLPPCLCSHDPFRL